MAANRATPRRRFRSWILIFTGVTTLLVFAMHLWFVHNARRALTQYIYFQSKGRIKLTLSRLELNLLSKRLLIQEADLLSTDSVNQPITYHVSFSKISLRIGSLSALLFRQKLYLDSLRLDNPVIEVMQWRRDTAHVAIQDELTIPQEMGKMYKSMLDAINQFSVRRIVVNNAAISLINKMKPGAERVTVSKIYFDLARKPMKVGPDYLFQKKDYTVDLRTSDQDIALPGGRHRLSFKAFQLQLFRERIQIDSCTITARATDTSKSNYQVFFKTLFLSGVDFPAMSDNNMIRADTVICDNPLFDVNLYRSDLQTGTQQVPDADKIIRELTGNLNLAYVGVQNAGVHFDIYGKTKQSFFNSNKDNFQVHGFRINPSLLHPVAIRRFDMTLRDYHLYNEDSSSMVSFDSLTFLNSRIALNQFEIHNTPGKHNTRNEVSIRVPYFELSALNWYQLIFEQNLVADQALLESPVINFIRNKRMKTGKKLNLFAVLQNLDSLLALDNVSVRNGRVNMQLGPTTAFNVEHLDFNILSNKFLGSTNKEALRRSVEKLSFSKGVLTLKGVTASLENARFTPDNVVYADRVSVSGKGGKINATVNTVYINNLQLDDNAENIDVDGIGWESAIVTLKTLPVPNKIGADQGTIQLRNIEGRNTRLYVADGSNTSFSTYIDALNATSLLKDGDAPLRVDGFHLAGHSLAVKGNALDVKADTYDVFGAAPSLLNGLEIWQLKGHDSLHIRSPHVGFTVDLNELFAGDFHLSDVSANAPVIRMNKRDTTAAPRDSLISTSRPIRIDRLVALEADINISTFRDDGLTTINVPKSAGGLVTASGLVLSAAGVQAAAMHVNTQTATLVKPFGDTVGIQRGTININLSNLYAANNNGRIKWRGSVDSLLLGDTSGIVFGTVATRLHFQQVSLGGLNLSSDNLLDRKQLLQENSRAWLLVPHGEYADSTNTVQWFNARYSNRNRNLQLDSVIFHPTQPLDSVMAHAPYQLDYITAKTGALEVNGFDLPRFEQDGSLAANSVAITNPVLEVFRDKKPPFSPTVKVRTFPVTMIRNFERPILIANVAIKDGTIAYREKNKTSRKEGTVLLTQINGSVENIKNGAFTTNDSLSIVLQAKLMDSIAIRLQFDESYTDSLKGFLLTAHIKGADLSTLNPMLVPLVNISIASGVLDSAFLRMVGREDLAFGSINIKYRSFRIRLTKNGDPHHSTFIQQVISALANTLVLKRHNSTRVGVIYTKRLSDRSFVNYIVKSFLSGVFTSVGFRRNARYIKQYRKALRDSNLPPVQWQK